MGLREWMSKSMQAGKQECAPGVWQTRTHTRLFTLIHCAWFPKWIKKKETYVLFVAICVPFLNLRFPCVKLFLYSVGVFQLMMTIFFRLFRVFIPINFFLNINYDYSRVIAMFVDSLWWKRMFFCFFSFERWISCDEISHDDACDWIFILTFRFVIQDGTHFD